MASLKAPPPAFFTSRLPRPSLPLPPPIRPPLLRLSRTLVSPVSTPHAARWRRQRRRPDDDAFEPPPPPPSSSFTLEAEIYDFMQRSANPKGFPTKQELLAAGRTDLVEAIAAQGGWLTFGWDLDDGNASPDSGVSSEDSTASTSGRSVEGEGGDSVGVEGILSRLDKERRVSFAPGMREKGMSGRVSQWTGEHDPGDSETGNPAGYRDTRSSTPDMWRQWSLQRAGFPATGFEAAEIVPNKDLEQVVKHRRVSVSMDAEMHTTNNPTETGGLRNTPHSHAKESNEQIHIHLQHLELKLKSVRSLLRSRTNGVASHKLLICSEYFRMNF